MILVSDGLAEAVPLPDIAGEEDRQRSSQVLRDGAGPVAALQGDFSTGLVVRRQGRTSLLNEVSAHRSRSGRLG